MNITNGTVEFERVQRPADFESKRARVTLSYAIDDGEDPAAVAALVGDTAHAEVLRMLRKSEAATPMQTLAEVAKREPRPIAPAPVAETQPSPVTDADIDAAFRAATRRVAALGVYTQGELTKAAIAEHIKRNDVASWREFSQAQKAALLVDVNKLGV